VSGIAPLSVCSLGLVLLAALLVERFCAPMTTLRWSRPALYW
jgi:hypothetical protein